MGKEKAPDARTFGGRVLKFIKLKEERVALEAKLEKNKEATNLLEARLLDEFANLGMQSFKKKDGPTVFVNRSLYAKPIGPRENIVAALLSEGLGDLVKTKTDFNTNTLSAWLREYVAENKTDDLTLPALPARLQGKVEISEVFELRCTGLKNSKNGGIENV